MQLCGSLSQSVLQRNLSQASQPIGGVLQIRKKSSLLKLLLFYCFFPLWYFILRWCSLWMVCGGWGL
jgi:hypothetical protein